MTVRASLFHFRFLVFSSFLFLYFYIGPANIRWNLLLPPRLQLLHLFSLFSKFAPLTLERGISCKFYRKRKRGMSISQNWTSFMSIGLSTHKYSYKYKCWPLKAHIRTIWDYLWQNVEYLIALHNAFTLALIVKFYLSTIPNIFVKIKANIFERFQMQ